ncbi:MAG: dihydroneopterin aldolase [Actinobacteria bacterium]|uniref:dihydroneopterin aldolase n=1 Tax=freshwater metagenome TaxID=449393 RepID=A0A6J6I1M7_9ZZZZ|nr:dihydroneopterin aldolase [Actinomycetota bacterium]MTA21566.1 dihydroneopterin aldolase [Actinomycetota bacterium]
MSDLISIKGIKGFGYHGVFDFERRDGQNFFVDIEISLNLQKASISDDLQDSIDYGLLTTIAREEIEGEPVNLIEHLAGKIADRILLQFSQAISISVTVHKPSAPVSEDVTDIAVTIIRP